MTARISQIVFVLALAATFVNVAILLALISSVRGTGRTTTINIWYTVAAAALWVGWVMAR